jgi:diguanylate cyclase
VKDSEILEMMVDSQSHWPGLCSNLRQFFFNYGSLMSLLHAEEEFDIDYAASLAGRSVELMAKNEIPATPANFTLWFNFALGTIPRLNKTIYALLANKRKFDRSVNKGLYDTFVKQQVGALGGVEIPTEINSIIANARDHLAVAISDNRSQIQALDQVSSDLDRGQDAAVAIKRLQSELHDATSRAARTEARLAESSAELAKIKESLAEAELRSKTDALTGIANRHMLDQHLRSSLISAMEHGTPLSVFMLDIDHFKQFNDRHGHQVGDQVLRLVASVLRSCVRDRDLAARYGGEELIAILAGTELEECRDVAERVRAKISGAKITKRATGEDIGAVTVSIGVAQFVPGEAADTLIRRCDVALYEAKKQGRNRTVVADAADVALERNDTSPQSS